jgi:hypothetical protein
MGIDNELYVTHFAVITTVSIFINNSHLFKSNSLMCRYIQDEITKCGGQYKIARKVYIVLG